MRGLGNKPIATGGVWEDGFVELKTDEGRDAIIATIILASFSAREQGCLGSWVF